MRHEARASKSLIRVGVLALLLCLIVGPAAYSWGDLWSATRYYPNRNWNPAEETGEEVINCAGSHTFTGVTDNYRKTNWYYCDWPGTFPYQVCEQWDGTQWVTIDCFVQ